MNGLKFSLSLGLCAIFLMACASQQNVASGSLLPEQSIGWAKPDAGSCGGTHAIRVEPCPVRLTRHEGNYTVEITNDPYGAYVADPGTCAAYPDTFGVCYYYQLGPTEWDIQAGAVCGTTELTFTAANSTRVFGSGYLKVVNRDCGQAPSQRGLTLQDRSSLETD